jgi:hypothetical protein
LCRLGFLLHCLAEIQVTGSGDFSNLLSTAEWAMDHRACQLIFVLGGVLKPAFESMLIGALQIKNYHLEIRYVCISKECLNHTAYRDICP